MNNVVTPVLGCDCSDHLLQQRLGRIDVDDAYLLASYSDAWTGEASTHARLAPCIFLGCKHHLQYAYPGQTCDHGEGADLGFLSSEVKCLLATFFWTLSFIHVSS
ncbi:uncharacterized protein LOC119337711 [Triticum dicoccoides]|uniref:uncharacterized protein LOC119337711 n=1 Tax=Triticum dicoccoides TaxID=85692 RepID=UPI001890FA7F|nr:uncharacterized protein LOC119337711 [Triticum dicoccoides]